MDERTAMIATNLEQVRARIDAACASAGRTDPVTIIAVTKTFPADDVHRLVELGIHNVGENRDQEAREKKEACAGLPLTWHMIGQIQTNKAASIMSWANVVQSIDRSKVIAALDKAALARTDVLIQVNLDEPARPDRGGVDPGHLLALADEVAASRNLRLKGLMAVAPYPEPASGLAPAFARLQELAQLVRRDHPEATWISAGMSGDLEQAIAHGATHVRLGGAILGTRPTVQ